MKLKIIDGGLSYSGRSELCVPKDCSENVVRLTLSNDISENQLYTITDSMFSDDIKKKALRSFVENMVPLGLKYVVIATVNMFLIEGKDHSDILPFVAEKR